MPGLLSLSNDSLYASFSPPVSFLSYPGLFQDIPFFNSINLRFPHCQPSNFKPTNPNLWIYNLNQKEGKKPKKHSGIAAGWNAKDINVLFIKNKGTKLAKENPRLLPEMPSW